MIHKIDPRQKRLFDPFEGLITPAGLKIIAGGWQGVFRHILLEKMPVTELATNFSKIAGASTKELYSMAGIVFLADFFGWTNLQTIENFQFRIDVKYALNADPGYDFSLRSLERYQQYFRDDDLAAKVFASVVNTLAEHMEIDVARQRLDSTHVFSNMATFGRTRLLATAIKRFLTQLQRHQKDDFYALPDDFRSRYAVSESRLFADSKTPESRIKSRQQAAEDLYFLITRFENRKDLVSLTTFKNMVAIFNQQCELVEKKVAIRTNVGGNCIQNPSDLDATYDGHKGAGYQVQISETCSNENQVQLITAMIPQTACEQDSDAVETILDQLENAGFKPQEIQADTAYAGDENVQMAAGRGVELVGPVAGRPQENDPEALTVDDFAYNEETGLVDFCPAGHAPETCQRDEESKTTRIEMLAEVCKGCPLFEMCPISKRRGKHFVLEFTDRQQRLAARRVEEQTAVFQERYRKRSGIESTNSGLKNRLGLGRLRVRGRGSVFRVIQHKIAGWNVLRASASDKMRAVVAKRMSEACPWQELGQFGRLLVGISRLRWNSDAATMSIWNRRSQKLTTNAA